MSNGSVSVPRNDDGEFELTLGNKQVLSVFMIIVVLLGIFFAMGYVVGRSSSPVETAGRKTDSAYTTNNAPSAMGDGPRAREAASVPVEIPPSSTTEPARGEKQSRIKAVAAVPSLVEPSPGQTFLQVAALAKPEADVLAGVLKRKGFSVTVAAGPTEALFRVLVGPAQDNSEISKLKSQLEAAGFNKSFPKKY